MRSCWFSVGKTFFFTVSEVLVLLNKSEGRSKGRQIKKLGYELDLFPLVSKGNWRHKISTNFKIPFLRHTRYSLQELWSFSVFYLRW